MSDPATAIAPSAFKPYPLTDPSSAGELVLAPFDWPVLAYLVLSGLACGAAVVAVAYLWRADPVRNRLGRRAIWLAVLCALAGGVFLVADLERQVDFHKILTEFNPRSVIAWGARILTLFGVFAGYIAVTARIDPVGKAPAPRLGLLVLLLLALGLGAYPALVLAQGAARPMWSSPLLAPLWLVSGVHGGMAIVLLSAALLPVGREGSQAGITRGDMIRLERVDATLILLSAALVIAWLYFLATGSAGAGGGPRLRALTDVELAAWLWVGVVFVGWLLPLFEIGRPGASRLGLAARSLFLIGGMVSLRVLLFLGGQGQAAFLGA